MGARTLGLCGLYWLFGLTLTGCEALERALDDHERNLIQQFRLGPVPPDRTNAVADDPAAAQLGRALFFETGMSGALGPDNALAARGALGAPGAKALVSCSACHDLAHGGADTRSDPAASSLGVAWTSRNTPTVINAAYSPNWQFWDGRADSLWSQALGALESPAAHGATRLQVAHVVFARHRADYEALFGPMPEGLADTSTTSPFPSDGKPGMSAFDGMRAEDRYAVNRIFTNVGKALEAFERQLVCRGSPFDRWLDGDEGAIRPEAVRGLRLFIGRAGCLECHLGPTFTDYQFHNTGTPQYGEHVPSIDDGRKSGIEKVMASPFNRSGPFSDDMEDAHLRGLTASETETGKFLTPGLRCVAQTAPYKHDGVYPTLRDVILHYVDGGATARFSGQRDIHVRPLDLTEDEVADLVELLESLTGQPLAPELTTAP